MKFQAGILCVLSAVPMLHSFPLKERQDQCVPLDANDGTQVINNLAVDAKTLSDFLFDSSKVEPLAQNPTLSKLVLLENLQFANAAAGLIKGAGLLGSLCNPNDGANGATLNATTGALLRGTQNIQQDPSSASQGAAIDENDITINLCRTVLPNLNQTIQITEATLAIAGSVSVLVQPQGCDTVSCQGCK